MPQASNTVWLKGDGITKEGNTSGNVTPGHLVERTSVAGEFQSCTQTSTGDVMSCFALESDFVGKGITTVIPTGQRVQVLYPQRGAEVYALVAASASAIVVGNFVESKGDGTVRILGSGKAIGVAIEAVDNSGNSGSTARIRIEIV